MAMFGCVSRGMCALLGPIDGRSIFLGAAITASVQTAFARATSVSTKRWAVVTAVLWVIALFPAARSPSRKACVTQGLSVTQGLPGLTKWVQDGVCDVGANKGDWTRSARQVLPSATSFLMVEANQHHKDHSWDDLLTVPSVHTEIAVLDSQRHNVTFWKMRRAAHSTGDSMFRETTRSFKGSLAMPITRTAKTLDELVRKHGVNCNSLLKLDVQGAELKVLKGGMHALQRALFVLLELPFAVTFNEGAPGFAKYIEFMAAAGFEPFDLWEIHRFRGKMIIQIDILFVRIGSEPHQQAQKELSAR